MCVLCRLRIHFMGGHLSSTGIDYKNFSLTRDRPVGNKVTNTKCQSWVSHVQIQCTIALVSDVQTEGKVSVSHKSYCHAVIEKHISLQYLRGICRASLWSAIERGTKECTWPTNWWIIFIYFLEYWLKNVLLRYLVNSMQNQARSTKWHSAIDRSMRWTCWPPLVHFSV